MRTTNRGVLPILFVAWVLWMVFLVTVSAHINSIHIPIATGAPMAVVTVCNGSSPILDQDTGDLDAMLSYDGKFIIAYQDRAHGSIVHVAQHVGSGLQELASPVVVGVLSSSVPQFSPSGPKQGSVALVPVSGGKNRLYYTQRKLDDTTGPYGIWCLEF